MHPDFAAYMPAKMFNYVNVVGVLRSGGDTKMCLFLDTSGVWFIGVPLAFLGAWCGGCLSIQCMPWL